MLATGALRGPRPSERKSHPSKPLFCFLFPVLTDRPTDPLLTPSRPSPRRGRKGEMLQTASVSKTRRPAHPPHRHPNPSLPPPPPSSFPILSCWWTFVGLPGTSPPARGTLPPRGGCGTPPSSETCFFLFFWAVVGVYVFCLPQSLATYACISQPTIAERRARSYDGRCPLNLSSRVDWIYRSTAESAGAT